MRRRFGLALRAALRLGLLVGAVACVGPGGGASGTGNEAFREHRFPVGFHTSDVLALDVDGDGAVEAVLVGEGTVVVVAADGRGGFRVRERVPAGENATGLAAGDLDEDGWIDLVVANHETDHVTLLFGSAGGYGEGRSERVVVGVDPHPHAVAVADLDGDGHLDFVVDDRGARALKLYRGRGDGTFAGPESIDVGGDPYRGMALADLDGDGDVDLVTPNPGAVAVRLNDGSGRFRVGPELEVAGLRPFGVAVADVDGDGVPDLGVGGGEGESTFAVWLGAGDGTFTLEPGSPHQIAEGPAKVRVGDVDGDGVEDFLVASYVGDAVAIATWGSGGLELTRLDVAGSPWGVAAGDFDGDGHTDLVTANDGSDEVSFLLARPDPERP